MQRFLPLTYDFGTCNSVSVGDIPSHRSTLAHRVENVLGFAIRLVRLGVRSLSASDAYPKTSSTFPCAGILNGSYPDRVLSGETLSPETEPLKPHVKSQTSADTRATAVPGGILSELGILRQLG